jgi:hypothetical protein
VALWLFLNRNAPDTTPDAFSFTDQSHVELSTLSESNAITVSGINAAAAISVSGGEYQVNGGSWTSSPGTVSNGNTVKVRHTSSGSNSTVTSTTLTIGDASDTFTTTTVASGSVTGPDAFTFGAKQSVSRSTSYQSEERMITGLSGTANISITGGQYQIDGGSWTGSSGTIADTSTVRVRQTSSGSFTTVTDAVLTINGVSATFTCTTHGEERGTTARAVTLSSASTTGTITSGSLSTITLADASGFSNGDTIIVELGGESGAGARGTKGVGGTWPALSHADATARTADTGQANNTFSWTESTGNVYQWNGSSWVQRSPSTFYMTAKAIPRALVTTVSGKSGNTFTLATAATVATTNANVYKDNYATFAAAIASDGTSVDLQPNAGEFAFSRRIAIDTNNGVRSGAWSITGHASGTTFFAPHGCRQMQVDFFGMASPAAWDLTIRSNWNGVDKFGLWFPENPASPADWELKETNVPQGQTARACLTFQNCTNARARRIVTEHSFAAIVFFGGGSGNAMYDCLHAPPGNREYLGWHYQHADGSGGKIHRCNITADYLVNGMEFFQMSGTSEMVDCNHVNAVFAFNSTGACNVTRCGVTVQANSQRDQLSFGGTSDTVKCFDLNGNVNASFAGLGSPIVFTDCRITATASINADGDKPEGFNISNHNTDVTITGTQAVPSEAYYSSHLAMGSFTPGTYSQGCTAVYTEAAGTEVSYIRISGTPNLPTFGNVQGNSSDTNVHHCMVNTLKFVTTQNNNTANP